MVLHRGLVWSDVQHALKMKTAKYDYYYHYQVKTPHCVFRSSEGGRAPLFFFFFSIRICRCKVKTVKVKSSQRQAYLAEGRERTWECKHSKQSHKTVSKMYFRSQTGKCQKAYTGTQKIRRRKSFQTHTCGIIF